MFDNKPMQTKLGNCVDKSTKVGKNLIKKYKRNNVHNSNRQSGSCLEGTLNMKT